MRSIGWALLLTLCLNFVELHEAKAFPHDRYSEMYDSLKKNFNAAQGEAGKDKAAIDLAGFCLYDWKKNAPEHWMDIASRLQPADQKTRLKAYLYIFQSYRLPTKEKSKKYQLLDSANDILSPADYEARSRLLNVRVQYDIAYSMDLNAVSDLEELKKELQLWNASPFAWAYYYYQLAGRFAWAQKNYTESLHFYQQALITLKTDPGFKSGQAPYRYGYAFYEDPSSYYAVLCSNIGLNYYQLDSFFKATYFYKKSIVIYERNNDYAGLSWISSLIGNCYAGIGMPGDAEKWYGKSIVYYEKAPRVRSADIIHRDFLDNLLALENIYYQLHHYRLWLGTLDSAMQYIMKYGVQNRNFYSSATGISLQKAAAYAAAGQVSETENALKAEKKFSDFASSDDSTLSIVKDQKLKNFIRQNMILAWLAAKRHDMQQYAELRDRAFLTLSKIEDREQQSSIYRQIKWILAEADDFETIATYSRKFFTAMSSGNARFPELIFIMDLSDAYSKLNRYDSAYKYSHIYITLYKSIHDFQKFYDLSELAEQDRSQAEAINLQKENARLAQERFENIILFSGVSFILGLLLIILFLNRQRLQNRNKYEKSEREKLKFQLEDNQKELSDAAIEIVRSNNAYEDLISDLQRIEKTSKSDNRRQVRNIIISRKMNSQEESWRKFNTQFEKMNSGFYAALLKEAPGLTDSEKKICALMALGLSNKEISAVTFQPIKSIYTYKNRLRKKFSCLSDQELSQHLSGLLTN